MQVLFCLEDRYGLTVDERDGELVLRVDIFKGRDAAELHELLSAWAEQAKKPKTGEITEEEYDRWRYYYPKYDTSGHWVKVPSQALSDALLGAFKDNLKDR